MFFEILLAILFGILSGVFTGLIPGLHINLVAIIAITLPYDPILLTIFIIAMSITHTFLDCIPGIFLGAPDPSLAITALPAHKLLHKGQGYQAAVDMLDGSFLGLVVSTLLAPVLYVIVIKIQPLLQPIIGYILLALILILIWQERDPKKAIIYFLLSGILGILTLSMDQFEQPLLPLLSGLFGVSLLLESLQTNTKIPKQETTTKKLKNKTKPLAASIFIGFFAAFLPGFGASQASIFAAKVTKENTPRLFLFANGAINTIAMALSLVTLLAIGKARNGSVVAIQEITELTIKNATLLVAIILVVATLAYLLGNALAKQAANYITKLPYKQTVISVILVITAAVVYFDAYLGFLLLLTATALGWLAQKHGVAKHYLLGCLLLPVLLFFL
ncbi:MAG: putative membrane protein [Candidatus Woesearchaeota archaeon]|jgi:putative membrane protein